MARRDFKSASQAPAAKGHKSGRSTLIILVVGMALGVGLTLGLTQWFESKPDSEAPTPLAQPSSTKAPVAKHRPPPKPSPTPVESISPSPKAPATHAAPTPPTATAARPAAPGTTPPKVAGFHDDFVKGRTPTLSPPLKPREIWWLQVAALRKEDDARRLRARLLLLNLDVVITPSDDGATHRVRVGPFKTEALARENEGLLNRNNLTPRLIKEPVFP